MLIDLVARSDARPSGVGRYALALARALLPLGCEARLVPTLGPAQARRLHTIGQRFGLDAAAFFTSYPLAVPRRPAAVVHLTAQTFATLLWGRPGGVVTVHDLFPERGRTGAAEPLRRLFAAASRLGLRRADAVIAGSEWMAGLCRQRGLGSPAGVTVASYGVDRTRFHPQPVPAAAYQGLGVSTDGPVLLFVGSEAPRKRVELLLHVLAGLRRRYPTALLVKVGPPWTAERRKELRALADALGVGKAVRWLDAVDEQQLAWLYNLATIYISAASREGFGLPVLEAMACGRAVAVSDIAAHREVVAGSGLRVPAADSDGWVAAIAGLLRDPEAVRELGRRAEARAAEFTWERTAKRTLAVYRTLTP